MVRETVWKRRSCFIMEVISMTALLILLLSACSVNGKETGPAGSQNHQEQTDKNTMSSVRDIYDWMNEEDGWFYKYVEEINQNLYRQARKSFLGINLRYRYQDDFGRTIYFQETDAAGVLRYYRAFRQDGILLFGESDSTRHDAEALKRIWTEYPDVGIRPFDEVEEYGESHFTALDPQIGKKLTKSFFEARDQYSAKPEYAMEVEPAWQNGYKFQIAFVMEQGNIHEIYIDVLYQTGEDPRDYDQLSDLVQAINASPEQAEAFTLLQKIRYNIKKQARFTAGADSYKTASLAGLDFSRLYDFLLAIEEDRDAVYDKYSEQNAVWTREEITREEYEEAGRQAQKEGESDE